MVDSWFFTLYRKHVSYDSSTSLIRVLYFISIFLDWRLGFEAALQLKGSNLRALQNESHMWASILNIGALPPNLTNGPRFHPHPLIGLRVGTYLFVCVYVDHNNHWWAPTTLIISISVCGTNSRTTHYFAKSQNKWRLNFFTKWY